MRVTRLVAAGTAALTIVLTVLVAGRTGFVLDLDRRVSDAAIGASRHHHWVFEAARGVTQLGAPVTVDVVCTAAALVLAWRRRWAAAGVVAVARLVSLGLEQALKYGVDRARPNPVPALAHAGGPSFPSGHSTGIAVVVTLAILGIGRYAAALAVVAVAVGASRVLLGVHYPGDVVAGLALGTAVTCATAVLADQLVRRREPHQRDRRTS